MSKRQQWITACLSLLLTLLVLFAGADGNYRSAVPVFAASAAERETFPIETIVPDMYLASKGASLEALRIEDRQAQEEKMQVRAEAARLGTQHHLLASRSNAEKDAQFEKARRGLLVAQHAQNFLGRPYVWGGTNPNGFDCSGFTQYVLSQFGITVPRNSYDQFQVGKSVNKKDLQPGDLVFFTTYAPGPSHLGIYVGDGKFVHALNQDKGVTTSTLDNEYYRDRFLGGKRVL